ncbi:hypothetical protein MJ904_18690 [Massilia sp. MB5]|uniref:hypothetical protein n=1 Tax=Massilia sp. MB5 TaxID=2919578 RepID=UPI001F108B44|nr:hypothetical protein [Massilia sp. MB5]UMR29111.1 hypothetical protein MJ904_18690 [Massilia sp. MB5]
MKKTRKTAVGISVAVAIAILPGLVHTQDKGQPPPSSYMPVVAKEDFNTTYQRMKAAKEGLMRRQAELLAGRYDLSNKAAPGVTMFRGKPVQEGVRVKLPRGTSWPSWRRSVPTRSATATCSRPASCHCRIRITRKAACFSRSSISMKSSSRKGAI